MYRQTRIYIVLLCIIYTFLAACNGNNTTPPPLPPPPLPTPTLTPENLVILGELQKSKEGYTYGLAYQETVTVRNCNNPLSRSDNLTEARTVDRGVTWNIAGELGGEAEASVIAAGARIQAAITSGYELEISDALQRSRTINLPVGPNSSVEYVIEWKPIIWSGVLPFTFQNGEARIEYQYEHLIFGEVVGFNDKTAEHCGVTTATPSPQVTQQTAKEPTVIPTPALTPTSSPQVTQEITKEPTLTPTPTSTSTPTPIPTFEPITNVIPVWSIEENGVRVNINASGVYEVAYLDDAYSPWPNEEYSGYQGWTTILRIYVNSPVKWGITDYGLEGPINHDAYLGPGGYYFNKEEAIHYPTKDLVPTKFK